MAVSKGGTGQSSLSSVTVGNVSGIVAVANGGTGTSSPSLVSGTNITISGTWPNQTVTAASSTPTTAQVLSATAGATAGGVGTYAFLFYDLAGILFGNTLAGSNLKPSAGDGTTQATPQAGTWRSMGYSNNAGAGGSATLWLRIA